MKTTKTTPNNSNKPFKYYNEFAKVITGGRIYHFGRIQAKVISQLYAASFTNSPWLFGKDILYKAGSHTTRVSDLFKSQPNWRLLIESDRRGNYRLYYLDPPSIH